MEFISGLIIGAVSAFFIPFTAEFSKDVYQRLKKEWMWLRSPYIDVKDNMTGYWVRYNKKPKFYHKKLK